MKVADGNGLWIHYDETQINREDPGDGTPVMVYHGDFQATYWYALGERELLHQRTGETLPLTVDQIAWLEAEEEAVDLFLA